jgi:hypothetical protein
MTEPLSLKPAAYEAMNSRAAIPAAVTGLITTMKIELWDHGDRACAAHVRGDGGFSARVVVMCGGRNEARRTSGKNSRVELFAAIGRDARVEECSIRELADRYHVHRRTVRQVLASAIPPQRKTPTRTAPRGLPVDGQVHL